MSNERIKKFVTDPPKSPKDMAERFNKIPWYWKATGVILDAALVAGYVSEKLGYVTPNHEGTSTNATESTPALAKTPTLEPAKVRVVQTPGEPPVVIAEGAGPILLCGDSEPVCPSDKECKITTFQAAPGVTAISGVCVDKIIEGK